jgi:hypothetical protein
LSRLARGGLLSRKAGLAAPLYFLGKFTHALLRDHATLAASKGSFGIMKGRQELRTLALAFFPQ